MKTKKILALALAAVLLVAVSVAGTVAYLTATSGPVKNTFTPATITVNIDEHKYNKADNTIDTNTVVTENEDYMMVPGRNIVKDPEVDASSDVPFYVFVTIEENSDWVALAEKNLLSYEIDSNWTELQDGVYWKLVNNATNGTFSIENIPVLKDDKVVVSADMTKEDMAGKSPKLTFNAYAIQQEGFGSDAAAAWAKVPTT